jgi:hypothetical protein
VSTNRITVLGTATLSGLTLTLDVQGTLPEGPYLLATGIGSEQFKAITNIPQQAGYLAKTVYRTGDLVLILSKTGTMVRFL